MEYLFFLYCFVCRRVRLFINALWSPAGKRADLLALFVKLSFSHWYPGSSGLLNCINS